MEKEEFYTLCLGVHQPVAFGSERLGSAGLSLGPTQAFHGISGILHLFASQPTRRVNGPLAEAITSIPKFLHCLKYFICKHIIHSKSALGN